MVGGKISKFINETFFLSRCRIVIEGNKRL